MSSERAWARQRRRVAGIAALSLALLATPLRAEQALPSPETRAAAQQLFERGLVLLDAGDKERALDHFLRSRALVPGKGNTANAAHCLHELGRYDEALELYEVLATRFAADLSAENTLRLVPAMRSLRERVGAVVVTANVEGSVLIDGRPAGGSRSTVRFACSAASASCACSRTATPRSRARSRCAWARRRTSTPCCDRSLKRASCGSKIRRTTAPRCSWIGCRSA